MFMILSGYKFRDKLSLNCRNGEGVSSKLWRDEEARQRCDRPVTARRSTFGMRLAWFQPPRHLHGWFFGFLRSFSNYPDVRFYLLITLERFLCKKAVQRTP